MFKNETLQALFVVGVIIFALAYRLCLFVLMLFVLSLPVDLFL